MKTARNSAAFALVVGGGLILWNRRQQRLKAEAKKESIPQLKTRTHQEPSFTKKLGETNSPRDVVDQASWESFPASDAPAWRK